MAEPDPSPLPRQRHRDLLATIQAEWDIAEADIKQAEQVCQSIVVPSIKELRYAGRRLIEAMRGVDEPGGTEKARALLQDANFNGHRARHDAIDAGIAKIAADVDTWTRVIGHETVLQCSPQFANLLHELNDVRNVIVASRENRSKRSTYYLQLEVGAFKSLVSRYRTMQAAEPLMRTLAMRSRSARLRNDLFGMTGIVFGVPSLVFAYYVWRHP